jgi:hypothetical protein
MCTFKNKCASWSSLFHRTAESMYGKFHKFHTSCDLLQNLKHDQKYELYRKCKKPWENCICNLLLVFTRNVIFVSVIFNVLSLDESGYLCSWPGEVGSAQIRQR